MGEYANPIAFTEDTRFEPVPNRKHRVEINHLVRTAGIDRGIRTVVISRTELSSGHLRSDNDATRRYTLSAATVPTSSPDVIQ
jgi:hypothetical protein